MHNVAATLLVFLGGFIIMVLEIIGARFLPKYFGSSFYVWVSQIGVVLAALAVGYYLGGALADRWRRLAPLAWLLMPAGVFTIAIPHIGDRLIDLIIMRHPVGVEIPQVWRKLDPVMGSALVFFLPCVVLATLSPYMIRLATRSLSQVGRQSGMMFAISTAGSIVGVFAAGFVLIEHLRLSTIFHLMGALTLLLGVLCIALDRWLFRADSARNQTQ